MTEKQLPEFPAFVVREQKQEKVAEAFSTSFRRCQSAYAALKGMPDIGEVPCELSMCNSDLINTHIDEIIKRIESEITLTQAAKEETIAEWEDVRSDALKQVDAIQRFLSAYPQADVEVSESVVTCNNTASIINELAKEAVPEGCQHHYELIKEAAEVLNRLYDYQRENGIALPDVKFLAYVNDPEALAKVWLLVKDMRHFAELQSKPSGILMGDGKTVEDSLSEHRDELRKQAAERDKLRTDFYNETEKVEEVQLSAIPINY